MFKAYNALIGFTRLNVLGSKQTESFPFLRPLYVIENVVQQLLYGFGADIQERRPPRLLSGLHSSPEAKDGISNALESSAETEAIPGKCVDEIPVWQATLGRFFRRHFHDQTVNAADKNFVGMLPSALLRHPSLAILAMPFFFDPLVSVKERFDGIPDLQVQHEAGPLLGLDLAFLK